VRLRLRVRNGHINVRLTVESKAARALSSLDTKERCVRESLEKRMIDIHGLVQGASALGYAGMSGADALRIAGGGSFTEQPSPESALWQTSRSLIASPVAMNPSLASLLGDEVQQCIDECDDLALLNHQVCHGFTWISDPAACNRCHVFKHRACSVHLVMRQTLCVMNAQVAPCH
jgi:hypothetical protein